MLTTKKRSIQTTKYSTTKFSREFRDWWGSENLAKSVQNSIWCLGTNEKVILRPQNIGNRIKDLEDVWEVIFLNREACGYCRGIGLSKSEHDPRHPSDLTWRKITRCSDILDGAITMRRCIRLRWSFRRLKGWPQTTERSRIIRM